MIIIVLVIFAFLVICLYGIFAPKFMVKHARNVDARVISCEYVEKEFAKTGEYMKYYEVIVDFYGLHGETITKAVKSEHPIEIGEVVRSRYYDKRGWFHFDADKEVRNRSEGAIWACVGVLLFMLFIIGVSVYGRNSAGDLPEWFVMGISYLTCLAFMAVGVFGGIKYVNFRKNMHEYQTVVGTLVDYRRERSDDTYVYYPIYEYYVNGIPYMHHGHVGGNSGKYHQIGRKVHILRNPSTNHVICKEDEKTSNIMTFSFGIIGIVMFGLLVATQMGILPNDASATEEGIKRPDTIEDVETNADETNEDSVQLYYTYTNKDTKACAYSIEINDDGKGQMILFPQVVMEGKTIDQYIEFEIGFTDLLKLAQWVNKTDLEAFPKCDAKGDVCLDVYVKNEDGRVGGRGVPEDEFYGEIYELIQDIVPKKVWKEAQKREDKYYGR